MGRRPVSIAPAVLVGLLLVTAIAAVFSARQVDRRADQLLDEQARGVVRAIDRRIETYTEKLYGVRGAFVGSVNLNHREYEQFLGSQENEQRYPGVTAIGFADRIPLEGRDAFIRRVDRDARRSDLPYPDFVIRPNAAPPEIVANTFLYPVAANASAFGFDLLSEPARRTAVDLARDRARPTATAPIRLVTEGVEGQQGILVMLPRYRGDDQSPPFIRREENFLGVAFVALRLPDLLHTALRLTPDMDLEIYDVGAVGSVPSRLRSGDQAFDLRGGANAPTRDKENSRVLPLDTAGRQWRVYYSTEADLVAGGERAVPWLIALLGILLSVLAAAAVHFARSAEARAVALADRRTRDLRESQAELARSNEELERFAFLASHDLQQPLRTVSGFLQLLELRHGEELSGRAREYVEYARRGTKQMSTLIDDLLAYSRAGRHDRPPVPVDLNRAWDAAVEQLQATIDETGATVTRGELPTVPGDPGQMTQVFANLVGNGIKYRGDVTPRVEGEAIRVDGGWEIGVRDNGIGIDPTDQEKIFGMFRRLHGDDRYEGTGMGLALVKRIVERSGGEIRVESERGRGSRFVVFLPSGPTPGSAREPAAEEVAG